MSSEPISAPQSISENSTPSWYRFFQDLKVLVWPTAVALVVALIHFIGAATLAGRARALAIPAVSNSAAGAEIYVGAALILSLVSPAVALLFVGGVGRHLLQLVARQIGKRFPAFGSRAGNVWRRAIDHAAAKWVVLFVTVVSAGAIGVFFLDFLNTADGLILKRAAETQESWLKVQLDDAGGWFGLYTLVFGTWLGGFFWISRWISKRFESVLLKVAFVSWVVVQSSVLVLVFAMISGAAQTVQPFPLVSFANQDAVIGPDAISFLIGADEKQFDLLVVYGYNGQPSERGKSVLYLPRSEVKWMKILEYAPLHRYGYYRDYKERRIPRE